jgi:hypothetical protein
MKKKKKLLLSLGIVLLVTISLFSVMFVNGKSVIADPKVQWVSHTEYWSGDHGSTIVRLADYRGRPYSVDECRVTILYPDKTIFIDDQPMSESGIAGNWFRTDLLPPVLGTYEQEVTCTYGQGGEIKTSQSFHLNPALEHIKTLDAQNVALSTDLSNVNLTLVGEVVTAKTELTTSLSTTETTLSDLMTSIEADLAAQLTAAEVNLSADLSSVDAEILARIEASDTAITARVDLAETNLDTLVDSVYAQLSTQLANNNASLDAKLVAVEANLDADLIAAKEEIISTVQAEASSLTDLVNTVNTEIQTQLTTVNAGLDSQLDNVELSLIAEIAGTEEVITTKLTNVSADLSTLVSTMVNDVQSYLELYLPDIKTTADNVYTDSQWLVTNAMNQADKAEFDTRFDDIDSNLALIKDFCSDTGTSTSDLCVEIDALQASMDTLRQEQLDHYTDIDETTTNTWDLLSGTITTNISEILTQLGIIRAQTTEINETLNAMRDDQTSHINIRVIS